MDTLLWKAILIFTSILNGSQLLKERICSSRSRFFRLRVDSILKGPGPRSVVGRAPDS